MNNDDLFVYILEGRKKPIARTMKYWLSSCNRYRDFAQTYRDKIRSKVRGAKTDEDLEDIRFELEIPYLFLSDTRFSVKYEKYSDSGRSPDFSISYKSSLEFNVEVARIRNAKFEADFEKHINEIVNEIKKIPSSLAFYLHSPIMEPDSKLVDRIRTSKKEIIRYIKNIIHVAEKEAWPPNTEREYPIPNFESEIEIIVSKPAGKVSKGETSYHGNSLPILCTGREFLKFSNIIFEKMEQMKPGMINILAVSSNSATHESYDLKNAVRSINALIRQNSNDFFIKKGFDGIKGFLSLAKNLSGVVFKTVWVDPKNKENYLWSNDQAENKIPLEIQEYLKNMR